MANPSSNWRGRSFTFLFITLGKNCLYHLLVQAEAESIWQRGKAETALSGHIVKYLTEVPNGETNRKLRVIQGPVRIVPNLVPKGICNYINRSAWTDPRKKPTHFLKYIICNIMSSFPNPQRYCFVPHTISQRKERYN